MEQFHARAVTSSVLAVLIAALAPGLNAYEAVAQEFQSRGVVSGQIQGRVVPAIGGLNLPAASLTGKIQLGSLNVVASVSDDASSAQRIALPALSAPVQAANAAVAAPSAPQARQGGALPRLASSLGGKIAAFARAATLSQKQDALSRTFAEAPRAAAEAADAGATKGTATPAAPQLNPAQTASPSAAKEVPASAAKPANADDFSPEAKKAVMGMFYARWFSVAAFALSGIAYPLVVIHAVGAAQMYGLFTIGSIFSIVISLIVGKIADKMPLKKYTVFTYGLRAVLTLANSVLLITFSLNYWSLLALTIASSWQFASLFVSEFALTADIVGNNAHKLRSAEAFIRLATIIVTVFSGLFLVKAVIDGLGYFWTFNIAAAIQAIPAFIMWKTLPDRLNNARKAATDAAQSLATKAKASASGLLAGIKSWAKSLTLRKAAVYLLKGGSLAASVYTFFVPVAALPMLFQSPLPLIAVVAGILWRSGAYQNIIKKHPLLKYSLLFVMIGAYIEVPLRGSVFSVLAKETAGGASGAAYLGALLGSFYIGQMPSATGVLDPKIGFTVAKIGPWKLKSPVTINLQKLMKWVGVGMMSAWSYFFLIPKTWLVGAAAAARFAVPAGLAAVLGAALVLGGSAGIYLFLHKAVAKISDRAWMRWEAASLVFMALPLFFGMAPWSVLLSVAVLGFVLNGSQRLISATFTGQAKQYGKEQFQYLNGMRVSFYNMATAVAYAVYGLAKVLPQKLWGNPHAFPFTWYVIVGVFAVFAAAFLVGSYKMPLDDAKAKKT